MFRAILILLALLLTSPALAMVYLNHNPGSTVAEFMQDIESVGDPGDEVVINGECDSTCTLYLASGSQVCVTPDATMGFHSRFYPDGSRGRNWRKGIPLPMSSYPPALRA
jgi:hypothetical protein